MTTPANVQHKLAQLESEAITIYDMLEEHRGRFDRIDAKLADHDTRFEAIDAKLAEHDTRFAAIDARFEAVEAKLTEILELLRARPAN